MKKTISRLILFVSLVTTLVLSSISSSAFANATDRVDQKMAGMNQLYGERMVAQAAPPSINVVTQNQVSNANDNTSIVMTPGQVRGKPIPGDISFTQFMMS